MRVNHCRVCHGTTLHPILDLGVTALANSFVRPEKADAPEPTYPLRLVICPDCGLVQIDEEVPPEELFRNYIYVSGTSDAVHAHAAFLARHFADYCPLRPGDLVMEAASNDGTVLKAFGAHGIQTLGIEPAANIAARANKDGVPTVCEFFNEATARRVRDRYGPARLILARHVLAHVKELHSFVQGLRTVLADDGVAAVECHHLLPFFQQLQYDTIYHEHLCYFSVAVLQKLFRRFDMEVVDAQEVAMHGGSILVTAQRRGGPRRPTEGVARILHKEEQAGLHRLESWEDFATRAEHSRADLLDEIDRLRSAGRTLAGYGAPAKGMVLLHFCGLGPDRVAYLVDRSPHKQGLLTPGHHIPVHAPERLLEDQPDVVLLLAWNFAPEIVRQQAEYLRRGGRFLVPIPTAHYWDSDIPSGSDLPRKAA